MTTSSLSPRERELIARHASRNSTPEEAALVQRLIESSDEARREFRALQQTWEQLDEWTVDVEKTVFQPNRLRRAIQQQKRRELPLGKKIVAWLRFPEVLPTPAWVGVVASACILGFIAVSLPQSGYQPENDRTLVAMATPVPSVQPTATESADAPVPTVDRDQAYEAAFQQLLAMHENQTQSPTVSSSGVRIVNTQRVPNRQPSMSESFSLNGTSIPGNRVNLTEYEVRF